MRGLPRRPQKHIEHLLETRILAVARMKFHEPRRALRIKQKPERVLGRGLRRSQPVKHGARANLEVFPAALIFRDRKSTRLNSSHGSISYAVFCLKKTTIGDFMICNSGWAAAASTPSVSESMPDPEEDTCASIRPCCAALDRISDTSGIAG